MKNQKLIDKLKIKKEIKSNRTIYKFLGIKISYKRKPGNPNLKKIKDKKLAEGIKALKLDKIPVCNAPLTSMIFDPTGRVSACCYSKWYHSLGKYPQTSLKEIWFNNKKREELIEALNKYNFDLGCKGCLSQIKIQNTCSMITQYNNTTSINDNGYPSRMDFEFANVCNYECIMCGGNWSSSIRKNREKLPAIIPPFDDKIVDELEEFIPHLKFATFLGGEPFLSRLYYKIWRKFAELNKEAYISVTTNCSIYNEKVQEILDMLPNMHINVSCDSLQKESYELIRKNGNFENFFKNFNIFISQKRVDCINCCPIIQNIYEIPQIIKFCGENNINITFVPTNTALGGLVKNLHENGNREGAYNGESLDKLTYEPENLIPEFRLSTLSVEELKKILEMVENSKQECAPFLKESCESLKNQIIGYIEQK